MSSLHQQERGLHVAESSSCSGETSRRKDDTRVKPLRILVISMGGPRRAIIEQMFSAFTNSTSSSSSSSSSSSPPLVELTFTEGIPSRELRTRSNLLHHCHRAQLIPPEEYEAYQNFVRSSQSNEDANDYNIDTDWTKCFEGIPIDPNRRGSASDRSLPYCVELWRKVKTINRGRSVLACFLAHLIALHKLTSENYDILLEDNVRCNNQNQNDDNNFRDQILRMIQSTTTSTTATADHTTKSKCHMRYYGWLGSIPNIHWIYHSYIPQHIAHHGNHCDQNGTAIPNDLIMVPCPIPSDIEHLEQRLLHNDDDDPTTKLAKILTVEKSSRHDDDDDEDTDDEDPPESQHRPIHPNHNDVSLATSTLQHPEQPHLLPGGTNLVWGTYAYWISAEAYQVILSTLRNDIGAMLWKGKRMRYYHVKPIDKVVPRIIRNHFDAMDHHNDKNNHETTTATTTTASSSAIQIPIRPVFFRAPMLSSNIHTKWDALFCGSTHYQMQLMSSPSLSSLLVPPTTTTSSSISTTPITKNLVSSYQDVYLSETEQLVVHHAQLHNYSVWMTPSEILAADMKNHHI